MFLDDFPILIKLLQSLRKANLRFKILVFFNDSTRLTTLLNHLCTGWIKVVEQRLLNPTTCRLLIKCGNQDEFVQLISLGEKMYSRQPSQDTQDKINTLGRTKKSYLKIDDKKRIKSWSLKILMIKKMLEKFKSVILNMELKNPQF